ncbi:hypothetical protein EZS27_025041 [termite gut metagenome]|jgi:hypothetical protein|uniref:Uncharacterized protein n=1 Tax=termite gut metagenome TaxID=433724 RepID=A0A5J4QWT0_9ZZZZ
MAKAKLIEYQDSYGEAMNKYGLERGVKGSDARHITLTEFYRNQAVECKNLQENRIVVSCRGCQAVKH